ncbi:DUF4254 domain-containing protein [Nocardia sp. NPDC051463]|uniref:DUF4254 domain-containing protein n=1 Tax=Nocardia sp. NPDC051463 TaxID=3154845 RepID=UPI003434373C
MSASATAKNLPGRDLLLAAIRGWEYDFQPLLNAAYALTRWHRRAVTFTDAIQFEPVVGQRIGLMCGIDRWVEAVIPTPHADAFLHTETVGSVVDRLALISAMLSAAEEQPDNTSFEDIWIQLDDIADGYQDLVDDLCARTRRVPAMTKAWPHRIAWHKFSGRL